MNQDDMEQSRKLVSQVMAIDVTSMREVVAAMKKRLGEDKMTIDVLEAILAIKERMNDE